MEGRRPVLHNLYNVYPASRKIGYVNKKCVIGKDNNEPEERDQPDSTETCWNPHLSTHRSSFSRRATPIYNAYRKRDKTKAGIIQRFRIIKEANLTCHRGQSIARPTPVNFYTTVAFSCVLHKPSPLNA